LQREEGDRN
jgi:hypothetical protein